MAGTTTNVPSAPAKSIPLDIKQSWYRVGYVEISIYQEDGTIKTDTYEGLDFKFKITQIIGRMPEGNMSVSICGLSHDTANKIVTLCSTAEALAKRKTVRVFAGYRNPNNADYKGKCLASMDIINATITTPPPDIWLQITGVYSAFLNNQNIAIDVANVKPLPKKGLTATDRTLLTALPGSIGNAILAVNDFGTGSTQFMHNEENKKKWNNIVGNMLHSERKTVEYVRLKPLLEQIIEQLNALAKLRDKEETKQIKYSYKIKLSKSNAKRKQYKTIGGFTMYDSRKDEWEKGYVIPGQTRRFRYIGSIAKLPTKISETYKVNALWEDLGDNKICLSVYSDPRYAEGIDPDDLDFIGSHNVKFLSVETGLIGIPKLKDSIELQCRFLLDENIAAGDYVCVNSVLMDAINAMGQTIDTLHGKASVYQIMKITFTGHLRGNEWYCDVCARRPMEIYNFKAPPKPRTFWLTKDLKDEFDGWKLNEETGEMRPADRSLSQTIGDAITDGIDYVLEGGNGNRLNTVPLNR